MDLTVIIPCKDHHKSLVALLKSIPKEVSVIVVENNSSHSVDELFQYLRTFFPNVKTYISDALGPGGARNFGMTNLETEWFTFADADDLFLPKIADVITLYDNDVAADLIAFPPMVTLPGSHELNQKLIADLQRLITSSRLQDYRINWVVPWSRFYRRSVVENNNLKFDDIAISEDVSFALQYNFHASRILPSKIAIYYNQVGVKSRHTNLNSKQIIIDTKVKRWQGEYVFKMYGKSIWHYPVYSKAHFAWRQAKRNNHLSIFGYLLVLLFQSDAHEE